MTPEITQEEKNIRLALAFGWKRSTISTTWEGFAEPGEDPKLCACPAQNLPKWFEDQKLIWDAVHHYFHDQLPDQYLMNLLIKMGVPVRGGFDSARKVLSATAEDHCEAFGKTLNLW